MKLALPDIDAYDSVYKRLVRTIEPLEISGHVAMETLKEGACLPLGYALGSTGGHSRGD
jgi:Lrp/AsnC family transcriptional regulator